jgi:LPXTG-motif cell wall-anchored protein
LVASIRTFVNFTELPATGPANVALMAGGGAILLASGAALVFIKRSRNKA